MERTKKPCVLNGMRASRWSFRSACHCARKPDFHTKNIPKKVVEIAVLSTYLEG